MARVDPELARQLAGDPAASVEAIVIAAGDVDVLVGQLGQDVQVTHVYRLIRGVAVRTTVGVLRRLATNHAVLSMEPVRRVKHQ